MGWFYSNQSSRKLFIKELIKGWQRRCDDGTEITDECIANCLRGGILWTVWERRIQKDGTHQETKRWINCDLIEYRRDAGWGNKPIDESMGPFYYSCPLGYLKLVPIEVYGGHSAWRKSVVNYHEERKEKKKAKLSIAI